MQISFSPQRSDETLAVVKAGDVLTINGDAVDLSGISDGADLPADAISNPFITGVVSRVAGELHVTLLLPHGDYPAEAVAFPQPLISPADGPLAIPRGEQSPPNPPVVEPVEQENA